MQQLEQRVYPRSADTASAAGPAPVCAGSRCSTISASCSGDCGCCGGLGTQVDSESTYHTATSGLGPWFDILHVWHAETATLDTHTNHVSPHCTCQLVQEMSETLAAAVAAAAMLPKPAASRHPHRQVANLLLRMMYKHHILGCCLVTTCMSKEMLC